MTKVSLVFEQVPAQPGAQVGQADARQHAALLLRDAAFGNDAGPGHHHLFQGIGGGIEIDMPDFAGGFRFPGIGVSLAPQVEQAFSTPILPLPVKGSSMTLKSLPLSSAMELPINDRVGRNPSPMAVASRRWIMVRMVQFSMSISPVRMGFCRTGQGRGLG